MPTEGANNNNTAESLLAEDEPIPFVVKNPESTAPVLLVCDHASRRFPRALGTMGLTRVFCEGGGTLAAALIAADLVDELSLVSAGCAIGAEGTPALGAMGIATLSEAPRYDLSETRVLGGDVLSRWTRF